MIRWARTGANTNIKDRDLSEVVARAMVAVDHLPMKVTSLIFLVKAEDLVSQISLNNFLVAVQLVVEAGEDGPPSLKARTIKPKWRSPWRRRITEHID